MWFISHHPTEKWRKQTKLDILILKVPFNPNNLIVKTNNGRTRRKEDWKSSRAGGRERVRGIDREKFN